MINTIDKSICFYTVDQIEILFILKLKQRIFRDYYELPNSLALCEPSNIGYRKSGNAETGPHGN